MLEEVHVRPGLGREEKDGAHGIGGDGAKGEGAGQHRSPTDRAPAFRSEPNGLGRGRKESGPERNRGMSPPAKAEGGPEKDEGARCALVLEGADRRIPGDRHQRERGPRHVQVGIVGNAEDPRRGEEEGRESRSEPFPVGHECPQPQVGAGHARDAKERKKEVL